MNQSLRLTLVTFCVAFLLSACGGGSGSGPATPQASSVTATLQGRAAKGIIINGLVTANELNSDGSVKNANVGSATTDSTGRYQIITNATYEGGPIEVTITSGANTLMVCDAIGGCGQFSGAQSQENDNNQDGVVDFGDRYQPSSLSMTAMVPDAGQNETIDVQITPFTHMAAQRARALAAAAGGTLDSTTVAQANSAISNMLGGVNILRTEPVDITDVASLTSADVTAIAYAAMAAAIAELADDDATTGEPDLETELDELSTEFEDGSFSADTLANITSNATSLLNQNGTPDTSGVLNTIQTAVNDAGTGGTITPQVSPSAGDSNIERAYAFIADLRTWGTVIRNEVNNPSLAFETQLDLADRASQSVQGSIGDAMRAAGDAIGQLVDGIPTSSDLSDYTVFGGNFTAGTINRTSPAASAFDVITISGASFTPTLNQGGTATVEMVVQVPRDLQEIAADTSVSYGIESLTVEDAAARLVATAGTIDIVLNSAFTPDFSALAQPTPDIKSVGFDLQASVTEKLTLDASGSPISAADPITFTGTLNLTVYPYQDANGEILDGLPGNVLLNGNIANTTGDSLDVNFTASLTNAAMLAPVNTPLNFGSTYASNNDDSNVGVEDLDEHLVYWQYSGNTVMTFSPLGNFSAEFNPADGSVSFTSSFSGTIAWPGSYVSIQDWAGSNADQFSTFFGTVFVIDQGFYEQVFTGTAPDITSDGFIAFILAEPEVDFNLEAEPANVGLQFTAQLSGLPEALFSITGSRTGFRAGNATVTISYGTRSITFTGSSSPNAQLPNATTNDQLGLTITNSDGVALAFTVTDPSSGDGNSSLTGSVTIDGIEIALVSETSNGLTRVTYNDGTFEIF